MTGLATPTGQNISPVGYVARTFSDFIYPKHKKWYVQRTLLFCYIPVPRFRRAYVPGGSFFFTVVTERHAPILCTDTSRIFLRTAIRECRQRWPFRIDAMVLPGNHLHAIWTLPEGDTRYSARWGWIKKEFTKAYLAAGGNEQARSGSRIRQRRRGVLQRRFWEHALRDEEDYARHFDYIHYNPVKHGYVESVQDWPYSTFHRWVKHGVYPQLWGSKAQGIMEFDDLERLLWNRTTNNIKNKCADYISHNSAS